MTEQLTAAQRARLKRACAPREKDQSEEAGELNVVPFLDIITNVMMFVLASLTVGFTTSSEIVAPRSPHGIPSEQHETLTLTVIIASDGYYVKAGGGSVAPAITRVPGSSSVDGLVYDAAALTRCVRRLKNEIGSKERQVLVTANPNVPAQEIVRAMDALRRDAEGELFPDVVLSVVR